MKFGESYKQSLDFEWLFQEMNLLPEGEQILRDSPPELLDLYSFFTKLIDANNTGELASYSTDTIMEHTNKLLGSKELCQNVPVLVVDQSILGNPGQLFSALKRRRLTALKRVF